MMDPHVPKAVSFEVFGPCLPFLLLLAFFFPMIFFYSALHFNFNSSFIIVIPYIIFTSLPLYEAEYLSLFPSSLHFSALLVH